MLQMTSQGRNELLGKVALVTGASRGIGRAVASAYVREGARVLICARNESELNRAVADMARGDGEIAGFSGDVSRVEDVRRMVHMAVRRFGGIHILVNNAGILGPRVTVAEYPLEDWQEVIRINLTGPFVVTQEVLQVMMPGGQGSIINVSSGVGRFGKARWGAYAVSKFGVEGFTQVLAEELKETGVRVNCVNPGATRTAMRACAFPAEDPNTLPAPEDITDVFVYLASDESAGINGTSLDAQEWQRPN